MSKIRDYFANPKNPKAFLPFFTLGDPNYSESVLFGQKLLDAGASILELGIPFSDPVADGPVIQRAVARALKNPFSFEQIFSTTKAIHSHKNTVPLVYLSYFNPLYHCGIPYFLERAKDAGVDGLVIPDLPFDTRESKELFLELRKKDMDLIHLVTPASQKKRIQALKDTASGFIYYVTSFGVTGERREFSIDLEEKIQNLRRLLQLPICAGFGISTPEQAKSIGAFSDGIIIGSAIQRIIEEKPNPKEEVFGYAQSIREALDSISHKI